MIWFIFVLIIVIIYLLVIHHLAIIDLEAVVHEHDTTIERVVSHLTGKPISKGDVSDKK